MNLKKLIYRARSKGVPVYCCCVLLVYVAYQQMCAKPPQPRRLPFYMRRYLKTNQMSGQFSLPNVPLNSSERAKLSNTVETLNLEGEVRMTWRYGAVRSDTNMIVVQVHRDVERLQLLILSLRQVHNIQTVLLVFSHDYYHDIFNKLVSSITFCRVMQIFYPYSLQLYPYKFPGIDPGDCLSPSREKDKYCSDRDGRLTEHKHHWWWKAAYIFKSLDWSVGYKGMVIFLEEDNYVLPDLLHMLRYTTRSMVYLQGIHVMSFGRPYAKDLDYDLLCVSSWRPPYDRGLAFNKTVWQKIIAVASHYCAYDDLSWSYSLLNAFGQFRGGRADMVAAMAPRVLSTGVFPNGRTALDVISRWLEECKMFPTNVKAVMLYSTNGRIEKSAKPPPRGNGGWGDLRDHLLCLGPVVSTTDITYNLTGSVNGVDEETDWITIAPHMV